MAIARLGKFKVGVEITQVASTLGVVLFALGSTSAAANPIGPVPQQVLEKTAELEAGNAAVRAAAAEALGFLRAYSAEPALIGRLEDPSSEVRRQAAMALAWCGGRDAIAPLLAALDDDDWIVRQAAHVSLTNLTGMEFPFSSPAPAAKRAAEAQRWREWWAGVSQNRSPKEVLELLHGPKGGSGGGPVFTSSTYRGPAEILLDGRLGPDYWQTKQVPFPQWCTVDLGKVRDVASVVVHQYGPGFVMTEYAVSTSLDNRQFDEVVRRKGATPVKLVVNFPKRKARYVRITSFASKNPTYPTTFFEIEIDGHRAPVRRDPVEWRQERGLRALGALGGEGATEAILEVLGPVPSNAANYRPTVRAAIRALGRLHEEAGFEALVALLDNPMWARHAAEALGDFGDRRAVPALLAAYPRYAKNLAGANPKDVPGDDRMGFPSEDRMLHTP